ncbi:SPFH domain-containing protein [Morganella morganii]|uniref:SPFH domain-containing protein n=2 Tax=Morganella morganii TaxID=582 RepID=UPI0032DAAC3E
MQMMQAVSPVKLKSVIKLIIVAVILFVAGIVTFNSYTIVQDGSVKVGTFLGKVNPVAYDAGLHFPINPFMTFDTYSTKDIRVSLKELRVPSQDKLKSIVDITVMLQFDGAKAPILRINGGTESEALDKYVRQKLISTILEFGKDVANAQDLYTADTQRKLQESIRDAIQSYASPYGYTIKEIMIQDITLPEVVQEQVVNTKMRQEQINQAKAEAEKERELAQKKVVIAQAERESAEQQALARERNAQASSYAMRQEADARLYAAQKESEANAVLQQTITREMINWKQLEIEQIKAEKYKGEVPNIVVGADYDGKMIMDMRSQQ